MSTAISRRTVDGVAIRSCEASDALRPPVLLVHGGAHGAWQWEPWLPWLARSGRTALALDWYSHGDSRRLPDDEWIGRSILDVQTEVGVGVDQAPGRPVLVGHSMGGLASLAYAVANPGRLAALVLMMPVVPAKFGGAVIDVPVDPESLWPLPPPEVARSLWYETAPESHVDAIYRQLQAESPQAVWEATRWTADLDVDGLDVPVLLVAGALDTLVPADVVGNLAEGLNAPMITLQDVGHGIVFDPGWPLLVRRMDDWLDGVL